MCDADPINFDSVITQIQKIVFADLQKYFFKDC